MIDLPKSQYRAPDPTVWFGRTDGVDRNLLRWHQVVSCVDLNEKPNLLNSVVLLGFCCDQGVYRNQGRVGASHGPHQLRRELASLPVHFSEQLH